MSDDLRTIGDLIWRLALDWRGMVDREIGGLGLTHAQFLVLDALCRIEAPEAAPTQKEVAAEAGLSSIYASRIVIGLVGAKLIARSRDDRDGRAVRLRPTPAGRDLTEEAARRIAALDARFTAGLGARDGRDATRLRALLDSLGPRTGR